MTIAKLPARWDRTAMETWLENKPRRLVVAIAFRTALTLLPWLDVDRSESNESAIKARPALALFRALAAAFYWIKAPNALTRESAWAAASWISTNRIAALALSAARTAYAEGDEDPRALFVVASYLLEAFDEFAPGFLKMELDKLAQIANAEDSPEYLLQYPLWNLDRSATPPIDAQLAWTGLRRELTEIRADWDVWLDWAEARFRGEPDWPEPVYDELTKWRKEWNRDPALVNADIKALVLRHTKTSKRAKFESTASPYAKLDERNRLTFAPNEQFDKSTGQPDLPALPIQQLALIRTLNDALPANAPKILKNALKEYAREIKQRGVALYPGVLQDQFAIISASLGRDGEERGWLSKPQRTAFASLTKNHRAVMKHYPLNAQREEFYAGFEVDPKTLDANILKAGEKLFASVEALHREQKATDEALEIAEGQRETAKIMSSLPDADPPELDPPPLELPEADRRPPLPMKKRNYLGSVAVLERIYNLMGTSATLSDSNTSKTVIESIGSFLNSFWSQGG